MTPNEMIFWAAAIGFLIGFLVCWIAYVHPKRKTVKPLSSMSELRGRLSYLRAEYDKLSGEDRAGQVGISMFYDLSQLMREIKKQENDLANRNPPPPMRRSDTAPPPPIRPLTEGATKSNVKECTNCQKSCPPPPPAGRVLVEGKQPPPPPPNRDRNI